MGRKRIWKAYRATRSERQACDRFLDETIKDKSTVFVQFLRFVSINELSIGARAVILFGITLLRQGLGAGSCGTYLRQIVSTIHLCSGIDISANEFHRLRPLVEKFIKSVPYEPQPAPQISKSDARRAIELIANPFIRVTAELMLTLPLRAINIAGVRWRHISIGPKTLQVQVTTGKATDCPAHRVKAEVPASEVSPWLKAYLTRGKASNYTHQRISICTAAALTQELRRVTGGKYSSYSLRYLRLRELIDQARDADGTVNWERAKSKTIHRTAKALKAHYGFVLQNLD